MVGQNGQVPLSQLLRLDGKVAVVTGGARGIGFGIVRRFLEAGAAVAVADLDAESAARAAREAAGKAGKARGIRCDVADEGSVKALFADTLQAFGRVDVLVNNAGIFPFKPALQMSVAEWDRVLGVNLRGAFVCAREFANQAVTRGEGGAIVNIGSIDSFHPSSVGLAAYDASKGAMLMFTRNLALEVAPHRIRVNLVAPGGVATEGTTAGLTGLSPEQQEAMQREFMARVPLGRWGTPDDIATVALFLATPASAYMTGAAVVVDGGRLLT